MANPSPIQIIKRYAPKFGLDWRAVAAYAMEESGGRWGAVGDKGTSFGPFQMHQGGALGSHSSSWAMSPEGLIAGMRMMAQGGAAGKQGKEALWAIYTGFGKGSNNQASFNNALPYLTGDQPFAEGGGNMPQMDFTTNAVDERGMSNAQVVDHNPYADQVRRLEAAYASSGGLPEVGPLSDASQSVQRIGEDVSGSFGTFGKLLASSQPRSDYRISQRVQDLYGVDPSALQEVRPPAETPNPDQVQPVPNEDFRGVVSGATMNPDVVKKWVVWAPGADRKGVRTEPLVGQFVASIAQLYGHPLTIGTGTNHRQYVAGTNRVSDHWYGDAADIPMTGKNLTRLGQDALIAAGADPAWARKQTGGVFNINGYNILFNTNVGGNHYNHLHVGLGRRKGSNRSGGKR